MKRPITNFNLIDSYRHLFPQRVEFTHCGNQSHKPMARLDRIYVNSQFVRNLTFSQTLPSFSDHKIANSIFKFNCPIAFTRFTINNDIIKNAFLHDECRSLLDESINNNDISFSSYEILKWKLKTICAQKESYKRFCDKNHLSFVKRAYRSDNKKAFNELMMNETIPAKSQTFPRKQTHHDNEISIDSVFQDLNYQSKSKRFFDFSQRSSSLNPHLQTA